MAEILPNVLIPLNYTHHLDSLAVLFLEALMGMRLGCLHPLITDHSPGPGGWCSYKHLCTVKI